MVLGGGTLSPFFICDILSNDFFFSVWVIFMPCLVLGLFLLLVCV